MADNTPPVSHLEGDALAFVDDNTRFGTLATINADGTPHLAVIWYKVRPDGSILVNSKAGRLWPNNLLRDPRCSLAIEAGLRWVVIRGTAEAQDDRAQAVEDICSLGVWYEGDDPAGLEKRFAGFRAQHRISFHIQPRSITVHLGE